MKMTASSNVVDRESEALPCRFFGYRIRVTVASFRFLFFTSASTARECAKCQEYSNLPKP